MTTNDETSTVRLRTTGSLSRLVAIGAAGVVLLAACASDGPAPKVAPTTTEEPTTSVAPPAFADEDDSREPVPEPVDDAVSRDDDSSRQGRNASDDADGDHGVVDELPATTTLDDHLEEHCRTRCDLDRW